MRVTVVGKEIVDYVKQGNPVQGVRLHVTYPNTKEGAEGLACENMYFSNRYDAYHQASLVKIGDTVEALYNRYGRIDEIQVVPSAAEDNAAAKK